MRRFVGPLCIAALSTVATPGCDEDEEDSQIACLYDYSVYSVSEYGTSFDEYNDRCTTFSSVEACDSFTEDSNDCAGGFCSEYSYTNVRTQDGTCEQVTGGDDDSGGETGSCQWTDDGECDEPEGTGLCPEGSDANDCA